VSEQVMNNNEKNDIDELKFENDSFKLNQRDDLNFGNDI